MLVKPQPNQKMKPEVTKFRVTNNQNSAVKILTATGVIRLFNKIGAVEPGNNTKINSKILAELVAAYKTPKFLVDAGTEYYVTQLKKFELFSVDETAGYTNKKTYTVYAATRREAAEMVTKMRSFVK